MPSTAYSIPSIMIANDGEVGPTVKLSARAAPMTMDLFLLRGMTAAAMPTSAAVSGLLVFRIERIGTAAIKRAPLTLARPQFSCGRIKRCEASFGRIRELRKINHYLAVII